MGRRACFSRARFHEVYYPHLPPLTEEQKKARPDVWHPIARRHPHTGWTSLYIGRWAYKVDGIPDAEAVKRIVESLYELQSAELWAEPGGGNTAAKMWQTVWTWASVKR